MGEYDYIVDELLSSNTTQNKQEDYGYIVDDLLNNGVSNDPLPAGVSPTGSVSTITSKPIMEFDSSAPKQASFGAMTKAALVKDNNTKIRIFAESRGIPVDRYKVDNNGDIVFKDDSGRWRYEEKSGIGSDKIKRVVANVAGTPSIPLSAIGAAFGGFPGAMIGGMSGETLRQGIAGISLGDPQTEVGNIADLGMEAALSATSEIAGNYAVRGIKRIAGIGNPQGRALSSVAGKDLAKFTSDDVRNTVALGRKFGIDLFPAQSTKSRRMIDRMSYLRDNPETADIIQAAEEIQDEQIQTAIGKFIQKISPKNTDSYTVGKELSEAANNALGRIRDARRKISGPLYDAAFKENPTVDVSDVVKYLDEEIDLSKGDIRTGLLKLRKWIAEPEKTVEKPVLYGPRGDVISGGKETLQPTLKELHATKETIDKLLDLTGKPGSNSVDNSIFRQAAITKKMLLEAMDNSSDAYKAARESFALMSPQLKVAEEGITGMLARGQGDNLVNMTSLMLASKYTRPETVSRVRSLILKQDGGEDIWNNSVRDFLEYQFNTIKENRVARTNFGGVFRQRLFGDQKQREIMKAALSPEQYKDLNDFMSVLYRTGLTFTGESKTVSRAITELAQQRETIPAPVRAVSNPTNITSILTEKLTDYYYGIGSKRIAEAIVSPAASEQLARLKKLPKGSEELMLGVLQFLGMTAAKESQREVLQ